MVCERTLLEVKVKGKDKYKVDANIFYERMVLEVEGKEVEVQEDLLSTHSR